MEMKGERRQGSRYRQECSLFEFDYEIPFRIERLSNCSEHIWPCVKRVEFHAEGLSRPAEFQPFKSHLRPLFNFQDEMPILTPVSFTPVALKTCTFSKCTGYFNGKNREVISYKSFFSCLLSTLLSSFQLVANSNFILPLTD